MTQHENKRLATLGFAAIGLLGILGFARFCAPEKAAAQVNRGGSGVFLSPQGFLPGTNALPGYFFNGDPNTGVYSPGADQYSITTGGVARVLVPNSGRVQVDSVTNLAGSGPVSFPQGLSGSLRTLQTGVPPATSALVGFRNTATANTTASNAINNTPFSTGAMTLDVGCWKLNVKGSLVASGDLAGAGALNLAITSNANSFSGTTVGNTRIDAYATSAIAGGGLYDYRVCITSGTQTFYGTAQLALSSGTGTFNLYAWAEKYLDQ